MVVRVKLCLPISALAPAVTAADVAPVVIAVSVAAVTAPADPPAVAAPVASTAAGAGPSSFRRSIAQCEPLDIFPPRISFVGLP